MKTQQHCAGEFISACKKAGVIAQLEKDILPLQGYKALSTDMNIKIGFGPLERCFPNAIFPIGAVHEILSATKEDIGAMNGFITALLSKLMAFSGVCMW